MKQEIIKFQFIDSVSIPICISEKNFFAFKTVNLWPNWSNRILYIYGPKNCGKSLILNFWKKKTNAQKIDRSFLENKSFIENHSKFEKITSWTIDDLEILLNDSLQNEEKILNILNIISNNNGFLLITSSKPPKKLICKLDDFLSRLNSCLVIEVKEPDDKLVKDILLTKLNQRQIKIDNKNLDFILKRIERTYTSAIKLSEIIDNKSLEKHSKVSKKFLKEVLDEIN